jgi:ankyrin repeat protein
VALGAGTEVRDEGGRTALMLAAGEGRTGVLFALGAVKADLEAADLDACTALAHAVREGHTVAAAALRELGARVGPCLEWAAAGGHTDALLAAMRLDLDLPVDFGGSEGAVLLASAARGGHVSMVEELCRLGSRVNGRLVEGCTALH